MKIPHLVCTLFYVEILSSPESKKPTALTIGVFDGVHKGHLSVLKELCGHKEKGLLPTVLTFDPHPAKILRPESAPPLLTSIDQRMELFEQAGVEQVAVLKFNETLMETKSEVFIQKVLIDGMKAKVVMAGEDFHFGEQRMGNIDVLKEEGQKNGFEVETFPLKKMDKDSEPISSTAIRRALAGGQVEEAAAMLGRLHSIKGEVVLGDQRGRQIGFPTANIPTSADAAMPADGVYGGWFTEESGKRHKCAINLGRRPTFYEHAKHSILEAHLLDFDDDLYGQLVEVEFAEFIRSEKRFPKLEDLVEQLKKDVGHVRENL